MPSVSLDDTVRITATFYSWSNSPGSGDVEDPVDVAWFLYAESASPTVLDTGVPTKLSDGVYYYDWTPTDTGDFVFEFIAQFSDGSVDNVTENFTVDDPLIAGSTGSTGDTLMTDQEIKFGGVLTPLCVNPDELIVDFPDANELDVAEALWRSSTEAHSVLKLKSDVECPTAPVALDYIKAAAACELSRTFGLGDGNEQSITLGDFAVTYRSFPKASVKRGTATTWCELAAALRNEMIYNATSIRAFVAGSAYLNPIPERKLRRFEWELIPLSPGEIPELRTGLLPPAPITLPKNQGQLDGEPTQII